MPLFLSERNTAAIEWMDDPNCDKADLFNTYRQFGTVNSLISQWIKIYRKEIRPLPQKISRPLRMLDIGFGGGDIPLKLARWCRADGIDIDITAIETEPRALEFVNNLESPDNVNFHLISSSDLLARGKKFDVVISNHLLHHLGNSEFQNMLREARKLSTEKVLFNDIERSDLGWLLFNILSRPVFRSSFITHDGLASIRRSFTKDELVEMVPAGWTVQRLFPFRLLVSYHHE